MSEGPSVPTGYDPYPKGDGPPSAPPGFVFYDSKADGPASAPPDADRPVRLDASQLPYPSPGLTPYPQPEGERPPVPPHREGRLSPNPSHGGRNSPAPPHGRASPVPPPMQYASPMGGVPSPMPVLGMSPALAYLATVDYLYVKQLRERGFHMNEQKNQYQVLNGANSLVFNMQEQSSLQMRQRYRNMRPFTMQVMDSQGQELMTFDRPIETGVFCWWNAPENGCNVNVTSGGLAVGSCKLHVQYTRLATFYMYDANGQAMLMLKSPSWGMPFTDIEFKIMTVDGSRDVGSVTHIFKSLGSQSDHYALRFPMDLDARFKALLIANTILLDYIFCERRSRRNRR